MLYLWMPEANGVWQWSNGEHWTQADNLDALIQALQSFQGKDAVVFFPSRDVQIMQQTLPKAQYKQLGTDGVKYLLEEYTVLPIDAMQVVHHFQPPEQITVLGVAKHSIETYLHVLSLLPVKISALLPDFLILPQPEAGRSVPHGR